MAKAKDLNGKQFGRLFVKNRSETKKGGLPIWECACSCGKIAFVPSAYLLSGQKSSCGCLKKESQVVANLKHGKSGSKRTKEYTAWKSMKARCANSENDNYGGRGITVCLEWNNSFSAFLRDMGESPSESHSIDRVDNNKGYEPGNCRWSTKLIQSQNRRSNRMIQYDGMNLCAAEWARVKDLTEATIIYRLDAGWAVEKIFTTPKRKVSTK